MTYNNKLSQIMTRKKILEMNNNKIQQNTVAKYPQQKQWFQKLYSGDMFKNGDKS